MTPHDVYPPRDRETNVVLIRTLLAARTSDERAGALARFRGGVHPSAISELDQYEAAQGPEAGGFVDDIFLCVAADLCGARGWPDAVEEEELIDDAAENFDFVQHCLNPNASLLEEMPPSAIERLRQVWRQVADRYNDTPPPRAWPDVRREAEALMAAQSNAHMAASEALVMVDLAARRMLDHPPSRMRMTSWRRENGQLLTGVTPHGDARATLEEMSDWLDALAQAARPARLGLMLDTALGLQEGVLRLLARIDGISFDEIDHAVGSGPCIRCGMHFMSIGHPVITARTPGVELTREGGLRLERQLNVADCPFCGWRARIGTPMVAVLPRRGADVICIPTPDGAPDPGVINEYAPIIGELLERARNAYPDTAHGDRGVIETFDPTTFFYALHTGTAAPEHHAFNLVKLASGERLVVDPTKNYIAPLAHDDVFHYGGGPLREPGQPALDQALKLFNDGDTLAAEAALHPLHDADPTNAKARFYLALAMKVNGREDAARDLLFGQDGSDG